MDTPSVQVTKRALLIGIDNYAAESGIRELKGCRNDVERMRQTLLTGYGFPQEHIDTLLDSQATQAGILNALDALAEKTGPGDAVVVSFHGHGSQALDLDGDEADGWDETILPYDTSRRGALPNRDISDDELHKKFLRLRQRTNQLTVIFDCCHSGSAARDSRGDTRDGAGGSAGEAVSAGRGVPPDPRLLPGARTADPCASPRFLRAARRPGLGYVFIAACSDREVAGEDRFNIQEGAGPQPHGVLTYYLTGVLQRVAGQAQATWEDVYQLLLADMPQHLKLRQHPQIEGDLNRGLFSGREEQADEHALITQCKDGRAELNRGASQGITLGCEFCVYPAKLDGESGSARSAGWGVPLGRLVVDDDSQIEPGRAWARIEEEGTPVGRVRAGCRALLSRLPAGDSRLCVAISADPDMPEALAQKVWEGCRFSAWLKPVPETVAGGVTVTVGRSSSSVQSGDLGQSAACGVQPAAASEPSWLLMEGGEILPVPPIPFLRPGAVGDLLRQLERIARWRSIRDLANPNPELKSQISLVLMHREMRAWVQAPRGTSGLPEYPDGAGISFQIHNDSSRPLYFCLLNLSEDYSVTPVYPPPGSGGAEPLSPGRRLIVGKDTRDTYEVSFPHRLPVRYSQTREIWKLVVSTQPLAAGSLLQRQAGFHGPAGLLSQIEAVLNEDSPASAVAPGGQRHVISMPNPSYEDWASTQEVCIVQRRPEDVR